MSASLDAPPEPLSLPDSRGYFVQISADNVRARWPDAIAALCARARQESRVASSMFAPEFSMKFCLHWTAGAVDLARIRRPDALRIYFDSHIEWTVVGRLGAWSGQYRPKDPCVPPEIIPSFLAAIPTAETEDENEHELAPSPGSVVNSLA